MSTRAKASTSDDFNGISLSKWSAVSLGARQNTDLSTRFNFPPLQGSIAKWNNQKLDVQIVREALEMKVFWWQLVEFFFFYICWNIHVLCMCPGCFIASLMIKVCWRKSALKLNILPQWLHCFPPFFLWYISFIPIQVRFTQRRT